MGTRLLPRITGWDSYRRIFRRRNAWLPAVRHILARHGLPRKRIGSTFPGTCAVYSAGSGRNRVLVKIFPPMAAKDRATEASALGLTGKAGLPVPLVLAGGMLEDRVSWGYLVLKPVFGRAIRTASDRIPRLQLLKIMRTAGEILRRLNAIAPRLPGGNSWRSRRRHLAGKALSTYRRAGTFPPPLQRELERTLAGLTAPRKGFRPVLLHADFNEDHVLVAETGGAWSVAGIIDFGDATAGDPGYEIMPVWLGLTNRSPALFRAFMRGYRPGWKPTPAWRNRAAAFILMHQFAPPGIIQLLKGKNPSTWPALVRILLPGLSQ